MKNNLKLFLPKFSEIKWNKIPEKMKNLLKKNKKNIKNLIKKNIHFTWKNLCEPLEKEKENLSSFWNLISHLNEVKNNRELRKSYEECILMLSKFTTWFYQNISLYKAYSSIKESTEFDYLNISQKKSIKNYLKNFKLSGIDLTNSEKKRYLEIDLQLSKLQNQFSNNVLDSTMNWKKIIKNSQDLKGLPKIEISTAKKLAEAQGKKGWLLTLDTSCYLSVLTHSENEALRKEMYWAYTTRASNKGPNAGKWDNSQIMENILELRQELAKLLKFKNFAEKSLENKMAKSTKEVLNFLNKLLIKVRRKAKEEILCLKNFTKENFNIEKIEAWDLAFYSEKQKKQKYSITDEIIRSYFPLKKVIRGLFKITEKIFSLKIKERLKFDKWHEDIQFFEIYNSEKNLCGGVYFDLYARKNKSSGAWMGVCVNRSKKGHSYKAPIAYLNCNFNKPWKNIPTLLKYSDILTLFHEFGHVLHHVLTEVDVISVSGLEGVPLDFIECPSQFMENWCWQKESINFISQHYQTKDILPQYIIDSILSSRNYQSGIFLNRQLELSLFDFILHIKYSKKGKNQIAKILNSIKRDFSIIPIPSWNRFINSFTHIFSGGYSAGYYSYIWADVLSSDIFSYFQKRGIFNPKLGNFFVKTILSRGGSENPLVFLNRFLRRNPTIDALLKKYEI